MKPPARLPATVADLDEWSVYADWLQTTGDPRGELIARDLALPEVPTREALAGFHELSRRYCKTGKTTAIGWCLGHARTLVVVAPPRVRMRASGPEAGTLAYAHQLMRTPLGSRLEELTLPYAPHGDRAHWRRLLPSVPPTCRRVRLALAGQWTAADCEDVIAMLPASVDEVVLTVATPPRGAVQIAPFVTDRFGLLDLSGVGLLQPQTQASVAAALAKTQRVRLRAVGLDMPRALGWDRVVIGSPQAAGLVAVDRDACCVFEPWGLLALQQRHGPIAVRAQIADSLPQDHGVAFHAAALVTSPTYREGLHFVRRGARWTLRGSERFRFHHGGKTIARGVIIELADGDALAIEALGTDGAVSQRLECTFVASDVDAACRRRFAAPR